MAPPHPSLLLLVMLGACTSPQLLADTPISGGSDEVRAAIQAELAAFDEATGFGRTHVSKVRVRDLEGTPGQYDRLTHGITVTDEHGLDVLTVALRHELCHALNQKEDHHKAHSELYERLASGLFSSEFIPEDFTCRSRSCQRDETFAGFCQMGPWVAHALRHRCTGDPEDGQQVLQLLAEEVWVGSVEPLPTQEGAEWASKELPEPSAYLGTQSTVSPSIFRLFWEFQGDIVGNASDVRTGESVYDPYLQTLEPPEQPPSGLPIELFNFDIVGDSDTTQGPSGWSTGPYRALVSVELFDQGEVLRHVWSDGERWWLVGDGCTDRQVEPFIAGDTVFTLRPDGTHIGWGPVEP
jgi:hypothetical protein